jgi:hypothetical protein
MKKNILKMTAFLLVFILLFGCVSNILSQKWITENQEKYVADNFYALEDNTVDVLFLGSSQVIYGISPVEMYDYAGISAYTLGGSLASLMSNYYWLVEACKTQSPSIVMLDTSCLFEPMLDHHERKKIESMRFSKNKLDFIFSLSPYSDESPLTYILPIIKYHSRWNELTEADFDDEGGSDVCYRGMNITDKCKTGLSYSSLYVSEAGGSKNLREMPDYQLEYFDKIVTYCQENNLELVLFKTPKVSWRSSDFVQVQELADQYGLEYMDFNQQSLLEEIGFDLDTDMKDKDHLNLSGAEKLSRYLSDYLVENFSMPDRRGDFNFDLQINREVYDQERTDALLNITRDPVEWLSLLKEHSSCQIFIATKGDINGAVSDEIAEGLSALGLETDLNTLASGEAYVGVLDDFEVVTELTDTSSVSTSGTLSNGSSYTLSSTNQEDDKTAKLTVISGGANRFRNKNGINIVVYSKTSNEVITSVSIDVNNGNKMTVLPHSD